MSEWPKPMDPILARNANGGGHAAESTSAHLRRVEAERDELAVRAADLEQVREELKQLRLSHEGCHDDYTQWAAEKAEMVDASLALKAQLAAIPRLPVTDDEVRQWYADRHLAMSCGPAVLFAALRRDFNQPDPSTEETDNR